MPGQASQRTVVVRLMRRPGGDHADGLASTGWLHGTWGVEVKIERQMVSRAILDELSVGAFSRWSRWERIRAEEISEVVYLHVVCVVRNDGVSVDSFSLSLIVDG